MQNLNVNGSIRIYNLKECFLKHRICFFFLSAVELHKAYIKYNVLKSIGETKNPRLWFCYLFGTQWESIYRENKL